MFAFLRPTPPVHDPLEPPVPGASDEIKHTTCYMCACRCGIRVHLRNGEVRYIDGNPAHPLNEGKICAKGSSGIMKQHSPARLTVPLKRRPGSARGDGEYVEISWDEVFATLTERLGRIRATDPKRFALFTGRDQMQALTGLWARQFGTPNYAAHGGFCSVNMAAGMIYSIGGSFWEFGGPDLEHARLFVMIGTAEDHHSNPLKTAISKFKRAGGRFVSINPVRTGYSAIADEWIPIRPGTDGALFMALIRELIASGEFDRDFVARRTNAMDLVDLDSGLVVGRGDSLEGERDVAGKPARPVFELLRERVADCTPEWASAITGIPAPRIAALAREMGETAMRESFELPIPWTDTEGVEHAGVVARPVAFHAMRGLAAHSNGFQTIRALAILMSLLGTIDRPGGFRHKAPFPKAIPPAVRPPNSWDQVRPMTPLGAAPLGFPTSPDDLSVGPEGEPIRLDKGFSWEHPLSAHGLMHNVITNAWRGDPYRIDTLLIFMANMAWNSTMNTAQVRAMLNDRDEAGEYRIPFIAVCDAFASEMTQYADLILPDTTYLERHDAMSLLDRPISEFDGPVDSVRIPVVAPKGQCKPFQEVLIELGWRLKLPVFTHPDGSRKYRGYEDFIVRYETAPGSGIGFLGGWRGADGEKSLVGEPNPRQWEKYAENNCVFHHELPRNMQYMRNWNRDYLAFARQAGFNGPPEPIRIQLYSPVMQSFRLAAQGRREGRQPPAHLRERIERHFDPLPFWSPPLEYAATDLEQYPLNAITQRPMAMYHSWDSQNAWLRQIHSHNYLMVNPATARAAGVKDGGWIWVESQWGRLRCMCRYSEAVEPGTVWTWNAIGKSRGAWNLGPQADESSKGFLLNHLISEELPLPDAGPGKTISNSDPVTGQAGWYDVRVRIGPAHADEPKEVWPRFPAMKQMPGTGIIRKVQAYFAGTK